MLHPLLDLVYFRRGSDMSYDLVSLPENYYFHSSPVHPSILPPYYQYWLISFPHSFTSMSAPPIPPSFPHFPSSHSALHPSLPVLIYSSDSRWFLMSSEMWSRDHSETGRHSLSSNSHHSSIIHTPILISAMRTYILKWYSIFMSLSSIWLHLFWQKTSVSQEHVRELLYIWTGWRHCQQKNF